MNAALAIVAAALFFACVPALLVARFTRPRLMQWWVLVLLSASLGWLFLYLWQYFSQLHEHELLPPVAEVAPPELSYMWQGADDGDPREFALIFGWLVGLAYLLPWLAPYGMAHAIRKRRRASLHGR